VVATTTQWWWSVVPAVISVLAALIAVVVSPWTEVRKHRGQRGETERDKLRDLIEKYHGRLLEVALDWDRRMRQLYEHESSTTRRGDSYETDDVWLELLRGKDFLSPNEYLFRSYVFRFLALCALARKFESEAFFIDAQYARRRDFDFLKFTKAFLWAMTSTDLHPDDLPGQSHFPNDQLRPLLDQCYRPIGARPPFEWPESSARDTIFDVDYLHALVAHEREQFAAELPAENFHRRPTGRTRQRTVEDDGEVQSVDEPILEGNLAVPGDFHKVIAYFDGIHRDTSEGDRAGQLRIHRWDRLCVLHLLVIAFIGEFGYDWQVPKQRHLDAAVDQIVEDTVIVSFLASFDHLGFPETARWRDRRRIGMADVRIALQRRVAPATV